MNDGIAELRRSFDAAFAAAPEEGGGDVEDLLAIRVAGEPHAVRVSDVRHLARCGRVLPVPGPVAELLGVTVLAGALVAVYDLAALLGYSRSADAPPWLVVHGDRDDRAAFAFDRFEAYLRVPAADLYPDPGLARRHLRDLARVAPTVRPVIDMRSLVAAIRERIGPEGPAKEHSR